MVALGMVTPTQQRRLASRTTARMRQDLCPLFLQRVPSKLASPSPFVLVQSSMIRVAYSVTAVGGTYYIPETAANFSGGGFSDYVRLF